MALIPLQFGSTVLCGFQPGGAPVPPTERPLDAAPADILEERADRGVTQSLATEHFVVRWGDETDLPAGFATAVADDLEFAWEEQVETMGWLRPLGTETFKLNVFIGNTGPNVPFIDFAGGYVTLDGEGFPFMVLDSSTVGPDLDGTSRLQLIAHEFNHTLQLPSSYDGPRSDWYYEATANWMAGENTQSDAEYESWGVYLRRPELSVYTFGTFRVDEDSQGYLRQYAAAMFVQALSDRHGPDVVQRSWDTNDPSVASPIAWLDQELEDGFAELYQDFAVRHAVGDHPRSRAYSRGARFNFGIDNASVVPLDQEGEDGEVRGPTAPQGFAWNRFSWGALQSGRVVFTMTPDMGNQGSESGYANTAVLERQGSFTYLPFDESVEVEVEPGDTVSFVLVSTPDRHVNEERFPYTYTFDVLEAEPTGCGCAQGSSPAALWWMAPFLLLLRRGKA